MANFELNSKCSVKHYPLVGICSILGVCLLIQTGCSRGPDPVALEFDIEEDTSASITLSTTETSDREVSFQISTFPEHGSISGTPPNIYYSPPANYFGGDEFEYVTLRRNGRVSKPATVKIDIAAVNDPPVAEPVQATTAVNMVVLIDPQAIDVDGQVVDYQIATPPGYGKVELNGAKFRFTPSTGFLGDDSFEYVAIDESGLRSAKAKVTVRVSLRPQEQVSLDEESDTGDTVTVPSATSEPVTTTPDNIASTNVPDNSLPAVEDLDVVMLEDSDTQVELKATDTDGTISRFGITTLPAHGTLSGSGSKRTYRPSKDFFGTDSFAYVAIDDQGGVSQPAVVSITVDSVNDCPTADSSNWVTVEDSTGIYIDLRAQDSDGSIVSYTIVQSPSHGRIDDIGSGRWLYVPQENFSGYDSFQWVAIDDEGDRSLEATTTVTVTEQPDPPTIRLRKTQFETTVGTRLDIYVRVSDPENDIDRFEIRQTPRANGRFHPNSGTVDELDFLRFEATKRGVSTYRLEVRDRSGLSAFASFTIEVINTPPVVRLPTPSYDRSAGVVNFTLRVRDPDGTIQSFVIQTIDNRRADSIKVNGTSVTDAISFTTGGACETEDGAWCNLNVAYKPDVIDGHSRRIRVYAIDDEGASSPKDFIRIETRQLQVARHVVVDDDDDDEQWQSPNPRVPPRTPPPPSDPPSRPPNDTSTTTPPTPPPPPPETVEPEDDDDDSSSSTDSDAAIVDRVDKEETKKVTNPNREVPRVRN